jgi:hypothetical protein
MDNPNPDPDPDPDAIGEAPSVDRWDACCCLDPGLPNPVPDPETKVDFDPCPRPCPGEMTPNA